MLSHIIDGSDADNLGIAGIEKVFDSAGIQYAVRDGLQKSINEFNVVGGAAVVMNISNGEIISLVSLPYFDNSLFTSKLILGKFSESYGDSSVLQHCISSAIPGAS